MAAMTATLDTTKSPIQITVHSDHRAIAVDVTDRGEVVHLAGAFPLTVVDASGHVWTLKSDNNTDAVYTY